jgi:hypothetical protein
VVQSAARWAVGYFFLAEDDMIALSSENAARRTSVAQAATVVSISIILLAALSMCFAKEPQDKPQGTAAPGLDIDKAGKQVRELVSDYVKAAGANDEQAIAKLTGKAPPRRSRGQVLSGSALKKLHESQKEIDQLHSMVVLNDDHILGVSDFFDAKQDIKNGMQCVLYDCVRQNGDWSISQMLLQNVDDLVSKIGDETGRAVEAVLKNANAPVQEIQLTGQ